MQSGKREKRIPPAALYGMTALLLVFYAFVLVTGLRHDGVSDGYRAYYIDRTVGQYVTDRAWEEEYSTGKEISFLQEKNMGAIGYGWSEPEEDGSWMTGEKAGFFIYSPEEPEGEYVLVIRKSYDEGCRKRLYVNEQDAGNIDLTEEEVRIAVPADMLIKGINRFEIVGESEDEEYPPTVKSVELIQN